MKPIEITTTDGVVVYAFLHHIAFVVREPLKPAYLINLAGSRLIVDNVATPFDELVKQLDDGFEPFDLPESTTGYVRREAVVATNSPELGTTVLVFTGGVKLVVSEGTLATHKKLNPTD